VKTATSAAAAGEQWNSTSPHNSRDSSIRTRSSSV